MSGVKHWTLACDESGRFNSTERVALVVAGVLIPGRATEHTEFRHAFKEECCRLQLEFPPHATDLEGGSRGSPLGELRRFVSDWVNASGGYCLGLLAKPQSVPLSWALHVRMLGSLVDAAGRIVAALGGQTLDLQVASRSAPLSAEDASSAQARGAHLREISGTKLLGVHDGEVREALESLRRNPVGRLNPWPGESDVAVTTASYGGAHVGIWASDLICNGVYRLLSERRSASLEDLADELALSPKRVLIGNYRLATDVRRVDQALRLDPPAWVPAARLVAELEAMSRKRTADAESFPASVSGSHQMAELLWQGGMAALALGLRSKRDAENALTQLAGSAQIDLELKHGNYEGTARALEAGWHGSAPLALAMRQACGKRELAARLWRLTLECANHRGDVATSELAQREFEKVLRAGASLSLVAELLLVRNLSNVALQNRLPGEEAEVPNIMVRLDAEARSLERIAHNSVDLGVLLELSDPAGVDANAKRELASPERELRLALDHKGPDWARADRDHGRCLGTSARSLAFAGALDDAIGLLLRARLRFEAPEDLEFNAMVIARVELERARRDPAHTRPRAINAALALSGFGQDFGPNPLIEQVRSGTRARFALDLVLRALLWAEECLPANVRHSWSTELTKAPDGKLYPLLLVSRTHPTELVARHAAEVLKKAGHPARAMHWFALSIAISEGAPEGTLRRLGAYTRALAENGAVDTGLRGSLLNPTFEYR